MEISDRVYGEWGISEPVIVELISGPTMLTTQGDRPVRLFRRVLPRHLLFTLRVLIRNLLRTSMVRGQLVDPVGADGRIERSERENRLCNF